MRSRPTRSGTGPYFVAYGLSLLGNGIASVVMPLLVLERTGDVLTAGAVATAGIVASAIVAILGGVIVDRWNRRVVSIVADVLSALSVAALPVIDAVSGLTVEWFLVLAVVGAVADVPGSTAREAMLPALARPSTGRTLERLVSTREALAAVLVLTGPGLGGLFIWVPGLNSAVLVVTATASFAAAVVTFAVDPQAGRVPTRPPSKLNAGCRGWAHGVFRELAGGWAFMLRSPLVLGATLLSASVVAVIVPLQVSLIPAFFQAEDLSGLTGLVLSALAGGGILGAVLYALTMNRLRRRTWFVIGMVGAAVRFFLVGVMVSPWLTIAGAALVGLASTPASTILGVLTLEATPDFVRGRVLAAQNALLMLAPALTTTPIAALAGHTTLPTAGVALALLFLGATVTALFARPFRRLDRTDPGDTRRQIDRT